jgi:hypothetical protein
MTMYAILEEGKFIKGFNGRAAKCECICGTRFTARLYDLTHGKIVSCGCKKRKHGKRSHRLYETWHGMMLRCCDPNATNFATYGGRGISVYEPWLDVSRFIEDIEAEIGVKPKGYQLDRIDNSKGYVPGNVQWSTRSKNCRNTRSNCIITINGVSKCLVEWAEESGIKYQTLSSRVQRGTPPERLLAASGSLKKKRTP